MTIKDLKTELDKYDEDGFVYLHIPDDEGGIDMLCTEIEVINGVDLHDDPLHGIALRI